MKELLKTEKIDAAEAKHWFKKAARQGHFAAKLHLDTLDEMKHVDRRIFQRISFDGQASLDFISGSYECCKINNLSLTGMFVTGDFKLQNVTNCFVKIFHNEKTGNNCLLASAKVVWRNDVGIGLKFTAMTFENYQLLLTTLSSKAERPEIILRELPNHYPFEVNVN